MEVQHTLKARQGRYIEGIVHIYIPRKAGGGLEKHYGRTQGGRVKAPVLLVQEVLYGSGRATRRWSMYFPIRRSLPARPEPDNTFWDDSTIFTAVEQLYGFCVSEPDANKSGFRPACTRPGLNSRAGYRKAGPCLRYCTGCCLPVNPYPTSFRIPRVS